MGKFSSYFHQCAILIEYFKWCCFFNISRGIALRPRRICDENENFEKVSSEYQNYLIARDHKPSIVKKQFSEVKKKTRSEARQKQTKQDKVSDLKFITTYNPALPNIHNIF